MKKNSLNSVFRGFTLAEALVALLVITIIIAASLPIITKKKRSIDRVTHGAYACYWQNGQLIGRYLIDQKTATGKSYYDSTEEFFEKNKGADFYYFSTKAEQAHSDMTYINGAFLVFGKETKGLPEELLKQIMTLA